MGISASQSDFSELNTDSDLLHTKDIRCCACSKNTNAKSVERAVRKSSSIAKDMDNFSLDPRPVGKDLASDSPPTSGGEYNLSVRHLNVKNEPVPLPNWTSSEQNYLIETLHAHPQAGNSQDYLRRLIDRTKKLFPSKSTEDVQNCYHYLLSRRNSNSIGICRTQRLDSARGNNSVLFST